MKKFSAFILMMVSLMLISTAQADYETFPVTDPDAVGADDPVNPSYPDIDGDWVVWQDERNGIGSADVFGYIFSEPNEIPICIVSNKQEVPVVSGQYAVWHDYRNTKREIHVFDLQNRTEPTFSNLTMNNAFHKRSPDISGDFIVWQDYRNGDTDIYMYNIATNTEQAVYDDGAETWGQFYPSVDGNRVVWMDTRHGNYQIYRCDIGGVPERVYATTDNQWRPVISGDLVVWEEIDGSSNVTLIAYELGSDSVVLSYAISGVQANAAVSDGTIVWQEHNGSDHDIRGYDTTTAVYLDIATANQDDQNPAISGRRVVWQRNDADIVGAEIPLPTLLQVDAPATGQMLLAGFHAEIQWQLAEGTPPEWVDVEYSLNSGADWDSIDSNIPFTDAAYLWDPIPDANAIDSCQIRVSDTSGSAASGISGVFSIFQCDAELTADLTGDCFVDIKDLAEMAGQWLICGNPHDPTWCLP